MIVNDQKWKYSWNIYVNWFNRKIMKKYRTVMISDFDFVCIYIYIHINMYIHVYNVYIFKCHIHVPHIHMLIVLVLGAPWVSINQGSQSKWLGWWSLYLYGGFHSMHFTGIFQYKPSRSIQLWGSPQCHGNPHMINHSINPWCMASSVNS